MKPARIILFPLLALLAGCVAPREQSKSEAPPANQALKNATADATPLRSAYVPAAGPGASAGRRMFRR